MRLLHTGDWHVGKTVRGRSRAAEHEAVLAEIVAIAAVEAVDLVLVAGDVFDTAAPTAESERIAYDALLRLADGGRRPVVVIAGNHDNARRLAAVAPVFAAAGVRVIDRVGRPDAGGVLALDAGGTPVRIALVPFVSQRSIVGVDELMAGEAADHSLVYTDRLRRVTARLAEGFDANAVNVVLAHAMVSGGVLGGGERSAHTIFEYSIPATAFPVDAHYVALGHLHRTQRIDGPCPIWYPGSPLQMDFGEQQDRKQVLVVDAVPGAPAKVRQIPLESGRRFRTVAGTLSELRDQVRPEGDDDFLRVVVRDLARVGLADEVHELFGNAVEIRLEAPDGPGRVRGESAAPRSPQQLFADYLEAKDVDDPRLAALFDELFAEASADEVSRAS